jgi:hypothetical protein
MFSTMPAYLPGHRETLVAVIKTAWAISAAWLLVFRRNTHIL